VWDHNLAVWGLLRSATLALLRHDNTSIPHMVDQRPGEERLGGIKEEPWTCTSRAMAVPTRSQCLGCHRVKHRYIVVPPHELDELSSFHLSTKPFAVASNSLGIYFARSASAHPEETASRYP